MVLIATFVAAAFSGSWLGATLRFRDGHEPGFGSRLSPDLRRGCYSVSVWTPPCEGFPTCGELDGASDTRVSGALAQQRQAARATLESLASDLAGGWTRVSVTGGWKDAAGHVHMEKGSLYTVSFSTRECARDATVAKFVNAVTPLIRGKQYFDQEAAYIDVRQSFVATDPGE
jgi:hypothetical protein